jgi:predicted MFS family arabinose efflux permease
MLGGFVTFGIMDGGGGVLWADVLGAFGVSKGVFGLASGLGLAIAFPILILGGRLADWFDKRSLIAVSLLLLTISAFSLTAATGTLALIAILIGRGCGLSLIDLAANAMAMDYERETGRHIMGPLHASYSGGGLLGALLVWVVFAAGGNFRQIYLGIAALFFLIAGVAVWTRKQRGLPGRSHSGDVSPLAAIRLLREPVLRKLAIVTGLCFFGEVLISQWVSIYLRDERQLRAAVAVLAIAVYGAAMFAGRLTNGPITAYLGARRALLTQGALTLVGGVFMAAGGPPAIAIIGCGLAGLGLAGMAPTTLSIAGAANPAATGAASGAVLIIGYAGLAAAPFIAGLVATVFSTRAVMGGEAVIGLLVLVVAFRLPALVIERR